MAVLNNGFYCCHIYLRGSGTALVPKRFGQAEAVTSLNGFHIAIFWHFCIQLNVPNIIASLNSFYIPSIVMYGNFKMNTGEMLWISNTKC